MTKLPITVTLDGYTEAEEANIRSLASRHNLEILELFNLVRTIVINESDPLGGKMLKPLRENNPHVIHRQPLVVPDASDPSVDISYALDDAQDDAELCYKILQSDPSMDQIIQVYVNNFQWMKFWAQRHPSAEWRVTFARDAAEMAEEISSLRAKAASLNNPNAALVLERLQP